MVRVGLIIKSGYLCCLGVVGVLISSFLSLCLAEPQILGIRHWSAPSSTRVVVDLSEEVIFRDFFLRDPPRVVVDLQVSRTTGASKAVQIEDALVRQLRMAIHSPEIFRIVVDLNDSNVERQVFLIPEMEGRPFRLVVHLECPELDEQIARERKIVQREKAGRALIVVIDPGHGGEDPGAVGRRGTKEKDVVLALAKVLHKRLNRIEDIRAFLTREGDYFLPLRQRAAIAHDYGADFFISIHADSSRSTRIEGASVYCLSLSGATDEAARILAEKENASDLVGGVRLDGDWNLNSILLDLVQTQTINDSLRWGGMVLSELEIVHQLKFSTPRQAGFRVLKAPDIPSILLEVGFLSNLEEERLLRDRLFQERIALAIERSICRFFFEQRSVRQDQLVLGICGEEKPLAHVVEPGQNLSQIATLYRTSIRELQQINNLKDVSRIYPGQKLLIP